VKFDLTAEQIDSVKKGVSILRLPELSVRGDGKHVYLEAVDSKKSSASNYSSVVGDTDKKFRAYIAEPDFNLLPMDYSVSLSSAGLSLFEGAGVKYWLAIGSHSKFD
jgi:hypothetical protein